MQSQSQSLHQEKSRYTEIPPFCFVLPHPLIGIMGPNVSFQVKERRLCDVYSKLDMVAQLITGPSQNCHQWNFLNALDDKF